MLTRRVEGDFESVSRLVREVMAHVSRDETDRAIRFIRLARFFKYHTMEMNTDAFLEGYLDLLVEEVLVHSTSSNQDEAKREVIHFLNELSQYSPVHWRIFAGLRLLFDYWCTSQVFGNTYKHHRAIMVGVGQFTKKDDDPCKR